MKGVAGVAVTAAVLSLLAGCGAASTGESKQVVAKTAAAGMPECPSAPYRPRATSGDGEQQALPPLATEDIAGDRFVRPLTLDDGGLVVNPPADGDQASYSGDDAVCEVLASTYDNNGSVGEQSADTIAVGLARVTVKDALLGHGILGEGESFGGVDGVPDVNPKRPAPTPYDDRLAWVVVLAPAISSSCPAMISGSSPPPNHDEPGHHGYQVFLVDAATGGDALLYVERRNGVCAGSMPNGPWVDVPLTSVSVPWQLESEEPDRSSAQISFDVADCDGYSGVILTDDTTNPELVRVVLQRPYGTPCTAEKTITEKMRVAHIGYDLPTHLEHAPTGPYVE